ncbi:hypothetical protein [Xenorhabdus bovienii]|uniref:Uncharacterized protein n=1 Tax=Xenorhabdus bovienii TaxID=40576 RepID=A0A0B6XDS1_XENBV|nr:hypothetical protein [Xenorhabdus bovienii]CDM90424.1 conserved protein of unknown function [Xenorhabdus bovienii]
METKFLSDGRKVAVLGKLNAQESIVQEIFVTESGVEIPSGENFTTKNLHDEPVKSYQAKQLEVHEVGIEKAKQERNRIDSQIKDIKNKLSAYRDILKSVTMLSENINEHDFSHFLDVITGNVKYAVQVNSYSMPKIEPAIEYMTIIEHDYGNRKYKGLRLLSVLGNSNGNLAYKINRWGDGSGGYDDVVFFNDIQPAREYVKNIALNRINSLNLSSVRNLQSMGIKFTQNELEMIKKSILETEIKGFGNSTQEHLKRKMAHEENIKSIDAVIEKLLSQ